MAKPMSINTRNSLKALAFLTPNLIGFLVFMFFPIFIGLGMGFFRWDGINTPEFIGLRNFTNLIRDSVFRNSVRVTIQYMVITVPTTIVLSMLFAVLLTSKIKFTSFFRAVLFFPFIASIVAVAIVWQFLYSPDRGPINMFLMQIGMQNPPRWLADSSSAIYAVAIMNIWRLAGYYMVLFIAGIQGISYTFYEAAIIDGANSWQKFWHITRPLLRPTTFFVVVISVINSFQVFTPVFIMTGGGPGRATQVMVHRIYEEAFISSRFGSASAMAFVLFLAVLTFTLIQFKTQEKHVTYMS